MQVDIVEIAPMRLHTVLHAGPVAEIPQAWGRLQGWLAARGLRDEVELAVGLCEKAPNEAGEIVYRAGVAAARGRSQLRKASRSSRRRAAATQATAMSAPTRGSPRRSRSSTATGCRRAAISRTHGRRSTSAATIPA